MIRVAVVGNRNYANLERVSNFIKSLPRGTVIISGGANGVDFSAEYQALMEQRPVFIFRPDWDKYGKAAGYMRNILIVDNCDLVVAFWDYQSKGTKHTIDIAKEKGIPVYIWQQ